MLPQKHAKSYDQPRISTSVKQDEHHPSFWKQPLIGYLFSVPLVGLVIGILKVEANFLPTFAFPGTLFFLVIVIVAFIWGLGPGIFMVGLSALALNYFSLPPHYQFTITAWAGVVQMLPFVIVGLLIAVITSQREAALRRAFAAERAKQERASLVETIFEAMADVVIVYDLNGEVLEANAAGRHFLHRVAQHHSLNMSLQERSTRLQLRDGTGHPLSGERWPHVRVLQGETLSGADAVDIVLSIEDGQDIHTSVSGAPLRDQDGKLVGAVCISHEVTERRLLERQAQELAHEALARASELEATFEAITDSVVIYDEQGLIRHMNGAAHHLFPLTSQPDFTARPLAERAAVLTICDEESVSLPVDKLPASHVLHGAVLTGTEAPDIIVQTAGGQRVQVSVTGAPIRSADSRITGAVMVVRDVSERRRLEQRTQQTLKAMLAMAEILVYKNTKLLDTRTPLQPAVTEAHEVVTRLAELAQSALDFQHVSIIQPDTTGALQLAIFIGFSAEQEQHIRSAALHFRASDVYAQAIARLRKDEVLFLDTTRPPFRALYDAGVHKPLHVPMLLGEQLVGILALNHGETNHVYTADEIALAKATAKLIALVIERERLVRERAEAQANELALHEANRRMDTFLSIASHELKTPLTSVKGNIQLADMKLTQLLAQPAHSSDESAAGFDFLQQLFQRADQQTERLNRLVNDLIDVSRIQAEKLQLQLAACELRAIVQDAVQEQRQVAASRSIGLHLPTEAVPVFADVDRIGQVVTNYLTNALKYSAPKCAVDVHVSVEGNRPVSRSVMKVPGLSPEEQKRIWERFYQAQGITVQSGSSVGLGIGLHICHSIIDRHHGDVGVRSAPGQGSTFWFTLPLQEG